MSSEERWEKHPSYGLVSFNRISGGHGTRFFGSALTNHHGFIELKVSRAQVKHELGMDWYYDTEGLFEVRMTSAQFAELITKMNVGTGTPCTLHSIGRERIPDSPGQMKTEQEKVRESFSQKIWGLVDTLEKARSQVEKILEKKSAIRKQDRDDIQGLFRMVVREIRSNAPFMIECFEEAAEKVVTAAKAEVEGFVTGVAIRTGLDQIRKTGLALGPADAEDGEGPNG